MTRTERQKLGISKWLNAGGCGVFVYATGVGKTRTTLMLIEAFVRKNPTFSALIAVPTEVLKEQWIEQLVSWKLFHNCRVEIFNTIIKNSYNVDLFIIDECHLSPSPVFIQMYEIVQYKYLLGLTATWERLDDGHLRLERYFAPVDTITLEDALNNAWVSPLRNYKVLVEVDNIAEYQEINAKFQQVFSIFGHDFKLAMYLVSNPFAVKIWAKKHGYGENIVRGYLATFMRLLRKRKEFVMSHPKKFLLADKILNYRKDKKCITFSAKIKDAEHFKKRGVVLHSKRKKSENKKSLEEFNKLSCGVISSSKACDAGLDVPGLSVGVILSGDSSSIRFVQRLGRTIRAEEGKVAEVFTLVVKDTIENTWYDNASKGQSFITINEQQLETVLQGQEISIRPKKGIVDLEHRF